VQRSRKGGSFREPLRYPSRPAARAGTCSSQYVEVQDLPSGWTTGIDQGSGEAYYFNEQTGESQWDPPQHQQGYGAEQGYAAQLVWSLSEYSGVRGFSLYTPDPNDPLDNTNPEQQKELAKYKKLPYSVGCGDEFVLGRWNMKMVKLTVSRVQCRVQVAADGTATLTSYGKGPTLWRARDTTGRGWIWDYLYPEESRILADGDKISLDFNDPEAAVFTCNLEYAKQDYAQQDYAQQDYAQQGYAQTELPADWISGVDEASGAVYYYNEQTGESQWDVPQSL